MTLANGATSGTVTQGVPQNLTTTVLDTNGNAIYRSRAHLPVHQPRSTFRQPAAAITTTFPGVGSITPSANPDLQSRAHQPIGFFGTGLSISSNPVNITTPGTASDYVWFGAPGNSQYFVLVELLTGTVGSTVRLPYVPNSMVMDRGRNSLYFGSARELMIVRTATNAISNAGQLQSQA